MSEKATTHLNAVGDALAELDRLTSAVEAQLVALRQHGENYANAVHDCRTQGTKPPTYSGSAHHARANNLVRRLDSASKQIGFASSELTRFGGY